MAQPPSAPPSMPAPEFSRPVVAATLPHSGRDLTLTASPAECAALAVRFGLPAVLEVSAGLHARGRPDGRIRVVGRLAARLVQVCVVSLEPFETSLDVPYECSFVRAALLEAGDSGLLDPDAPDEEGYEGTSFDLGESVAQALALALDPWPRQPGAVAPGALASDDGDGADDASPPASPFAVLARRRPN